jgi:nitrate/nitrite-specific signal transduction histidine kinase
MDTTKKNTRKMQRFAQFISYYVTIFLAIAGVVVALLNIWVLSKLSPINERISILASRINAYDEKYNNVVQKPEFEQVITRINHISGRVDQIYGILSKK